MTTDGRNVSLRALSFFFFFFIVVPRVEEARNHFNVCSPLLRHRYTPFLMQGSRHGFSNNIPRTRKSASGINRYWVRRDSYFFFFFFVCASRFERMTRPLVLTYFYRLTENRGEKICTWKKKYRSEDSLLKHFLKITWPRGNAILHSRHCTGWILEFRVITERLQYYKESKRGRRSGSRMLFHSCSNMWKGFLETLVLAIFSLRDN